MADTTSFKPHSRGSNRQILGREELYELWNQCPLPQDQLLTNLGLYMRSSTLAKLLFLNEIYQLIIDIPGCVIEFGTWWGQSLVLFENFRAVYEPYNFCRRVIGFDTFSGYINISEQDKRSETIRERNYDTCDGYEAYLDRLLDYHESENTMAHIKKHRLVKGDVTETVPAFFVENPETLVALAYFDFAIYEPTRVCLEAIAPRLLKGSVIAFDELNAPEYPGETRALLETIGARTNTIRRSRFLPDRSYLIVS